MVSGRTLRWSLSLSAHDYQFKYKPGTQVAHADALSRLPLPDAPTTVPMPAGTVHLKKEKKKNRQSPWISAELIKLVRKKKRLYKKAKISNHDKSWSTYNKESNLWNKECNKARWEYPDKLADDMHNNNERKLFWNYVQSRRKGSYDLIAIKLDNGNLLTNEGDIAESMNENFSYAFTAENLENFPSFDQVIKDKDLSLLHCSPNDVSKILSELKPRKSPGPNSIHPMILRKCAGLLASSLSDVFNVSFTSGMLPHNWKLADITPLHKKVAKTIVQSH
ncbi:uncharacterized protein LOC111319037 [Stylophora pistillata]|uniref:uncharacterized protein LOC111319037 n=1 Tax=Stylophora pistillata TaxID=50429 RepID=UPI000C053AA6|nr:uncharacterized protein LOC111319037 [Stylophora pistillata]